VPENRSV